MKIGGLQKTTLVDYPGKVACTVFTVGCNYKCPFCYNSGLVLPADSPSARLQSSDAVLDGAKGKTNALASERSELKIASAHAEIKEFFDFLKDRIGLLEGVVICGGEPTIHADLPEFITKIKELGFAVKLDTNGSNPRMLEELISSKLVDYVALDVKAPKGKYASLAGANADFGKVEESIVVLKKSGIEYEFRTTVVPTLLDKDGVTGIAKLIGPAGRYFLQGFQPKTTVDPVLEKVRPYSAAELEEIRDAVASQFGVCKVR